MIEAEDSCVDAEIWSSAVALFSVQSLSSLSLLQHLRSTYRIIPGSRDWPAETQGLGEGCC